MKINQWGTRFVSLFLSLAMSLISPVKGRADTRADADRIIQISHDGAEQLAETLFRYYLFQGLGSVVQQSQAMAELVDSTDTMLAVLSENSQKLTGHEVGVEDAISLASQDWSSKSAVQEKVVMLMNAHRSMSQSLRSFRYSSNTAQLVAERGVELISKILDHLRMACDTGIESQFYIPALPPITIRPPEFFVGFQLKMSLENDEGPSSNLNVDYSPMPDPSISDIFGDTEEAGEVAATVGVVSTSLLAVWLAGGTEAFLASAATQAAFMGLAILIVAAIVFVISVFQDIDTRKKARKQVTAVEDSVRHRANAVDVARHFRGLCEKHATPLLALENQLTSGVDPTPPTIAEKDLINEFFKDASKVFKQLEDEFIRLTEVDGKTPEQARESLKDHAATKALLELVNKRMTLGQFVQSLRAQLAEVVLQNQSVEEEVEGLMRDQFLSPDSHYRKMQRRLSQLDERILAMYGASYSHNLNRDYPSLFENLHEEYYEREDSSKLITRWYSFLAAYIDQRDLFNSTDRSKLETEEYKKLLFELQTLNTDMEFFVFGYPHNEAIPQLLPLVHEILERHSYE